MADTQEFKIPPRSQVRPIVMGVALVFAGSFAGWYFLKLDEPNYQFGLGGLVMSAVGLMLASITAIMYPRSFVHVTLSDEGFEIRGPNNKESGTWGQVTQVVISPDRSAFVVARGPKKAARIRVNSPAGPDDENLVEAAKAFQARLFAYRTGAGKDHVQAKPSDVGLDRTYVAPDTSLDNYGFDEE